MRRKLGALRVRALAAALVLVLVPLLGATGPGTAAAAAAVVEIRTISNRADLISGGDALVEVTFPAGVNPAVARLDVDGRDVTSAFAIRPGGRFLGVVTALRVGSNGLTARLPDGSGARLTITNHPIGGPVFSGPQIQPWTCAAGAFDAQCNRPPTFAFMYKSTNPSKSGFQPYDPANPPTDVAPTTTDEGKTVPFVIRVETGAIDRDEYKVAVLFDPAKAWEPWAPQEAFNHKLVVTHGASCDTAYIQGSAPSLFADTVAGSSPTVALSRGFVVMSHALDNAGHNCNILTEAEALIMTKEHVIETYGELRYTIGVGCSGGSLVQQQVANAYPGFYQGITPQCSFPDAWSGMQYEDYHLLRDYFEHPDRWDPGVAWTSEHEEGVYGHPNPANAVVFNTAIPDKGYPNRTCPGVSSDKLYDPATNPTGVRCTFQDYMVNVFGRRPDGFAARPWDNVGIEYGLNALKSGQISTAQYVDVNEKVGGRTIDHEHQTAREVADPFALAAMYRSGAINSANNLDQVAIIDLRGPDPGAFHDVYRTYAMRTRLIREHGTADNQALWRGPEPLIGTTTYSEQALVVMDSWLAAVEADGRDLSVAQKILQDKPAAAADRCSDGAGQDAPASSCDAIVQSYSSPRIEAGMPFTDDVMKCQLKPLNQSDYFPTLFSADEWARMQAIFPDGVCDYSKPGVSQYKTVPWMTYEDTIGGRPMGPAPVSVPFGPGGLSAVDSAYFAEGSTLDGFSEYVLLANPSTVPVSANLTYYFDDGTAPKATTVSVPAQGRTTINVADAVGTGRTGVSVGIAGASAPIVAERSMYFSRDLGPGTVNGSHTVLGAQAPRTDWSFAEGSTQDGFTEYLTFQNPGPTAAAVGLTFSVEGGRVLSSTISVPAGQRRTLDVATVIGSVTGHSTSVTSDQPVLAERSEYFIRAVSDDGAVINGGHATFGASPSATFDFAEGTVLPEFAPYLTLANFSTVPAPVTITYFYSDGTSAERFATVDPASRRTVRVFDTADPAGVGRDVPDPVSRGISIRVATTAPEGVLAERPEYFHRAITAGGTVIDDGHVVVGATALSSAWSFAEGSTLPGFFPFLTIENPNGAPATVTITYTPDRGAPVLRAVAVPATSRTTVQVYGGGDQGGIGAEVTGFGIFVTSTQPVLVERPIYVDRPLVGSTQIVGGSTVIGLPA